jgi:hypothetical protein
MQVKQLRARAKYSYTIEDGIVCIVDHGMGLSVTNDAEQVINDLDNAGVPLDTMRVIYRDGEGIWDEMLVQDGCFADFRSIGERNKEAAKAKLRRQQSSR